MQSFKKNSKEKSESIFLVECENIKEEKYKIVKDIFYIVRVIFLIVVVISLFTMAIVELATYEKIPWKVLGEKTYDIFEMEYSQSWSEFSFKYIDDNGKLKSITLEMELDEIEDELLYITDSNKIHIEKSQKISDFKGKEEKEEISKLDLTEETYKEYFK